MNSIETKRVMLQQRLDAKKTQQERNLMGQFSTPKPLADSIVHAALQYAHDETIRFLDTSIGTGVFYSSLLDNVNANSISHACGFEIDPHYALPSRELWQGNRIAYVTGDFLNFPPPDDEQEKYNIIVSNPPYIRHHHIATEQKKQLQNRILKSFGLSFSGLTGLYGYFLTLSALWLKTGGISAWLVPNEFMDVNYGKGIKEFLLNNVRLLRIHRFNPLDVQFNDALVTSVVVFYTTGKTTDSVLFTTGRNCERTDSQKVASRKNIDPQDKWSNYFSEQTRITRSNTALSIGDFFTVKRGIATGSNKHFILGRRQVNTLGVPSQYIKPILPSPRYIRKNIIDVEGGHIAGLENRYLLDITCSEKHIDKLPKSLVEYLKKAYSEIKDNYVIRHRSPWFRQESRPVCPFLMSYMGRNEPFRLFFNKTDAIAPNVYLMLYPKFNWETTGAQDTSFLEALYNALKNITVDTFVSHGRVYGGGLYKLEPKELMNIPVGNIFPPDLIEGIQKRSDKKLQAELF